MSDNSPSAVAAQHDPNSPLLRENADLRARLAAFERENVIAGQFNGEVPRYQINEPVYLDDTLFDAGMVIDWTDTPNLSMVPLNESARHRMAAEIERQTDGARAVAQSRGRVFTGLVNDRNVLLDLAMSDAKADSAPVPVIQMPTVHAQPPAMPHTEEARRRPGRPRKAMPVAQAAVPMDRGAPMLAPSPANPHGLPDAITGRRVG